MTTGMFAVTMLVVGIAAAASLVVLGWWAFTVVRGSAGSTSRSQCGYRPSSSDSWSIGTLTYEENRLIYSRSGGSFASKVRHWDRDVLDVNIGLPVDGAEVASALRGVDMISVPCRYGEETFELAVTLGRYTALRSWVEAIPPGSHANVA
ncbi:MAG: DUF2550 family protein [Ornithinimicrobium sp.]